MAASLNSDPSRPTAAHPHQGPYHDLCNHRFRQDRPGPGQGIRPQRHRGLRRDPRDPESFASDAAAIEPGIVPTTLADAVEADILFLAVGFRAHPDVAKALPSWEGKTIVDVTNAYGVPPEELGDQPSSKVVALAFAGARLVKGFNHLGASVLGRNPAVNGGKRVVFLASDDDDAAAQIGALAERLDFAPVELGRLGDGGLLVHGRGNSWGRLIFQDLIKVDG